MMKKCLSALFFLLFTAGMAYAELKLSLTDDIQMRVGGDMRARWEFFDRTVISPDGMGKNHPAYQYLRVRTRLWTAFDVAEDVTFNIRLANRVHKVSSSPANPNDQDAATWEFPDEWYLDDCNVEIRNFLMEGLSLKIGRQSLTLGNGMILSDPTPFDQGRSAFTDGVVVTYKGEKDKLTILATYDTWKDGTVFINDRNRRLRSADIFTLATYWTHTVNEAFQFDLYYFYNDADDTHPYEAERCHAPDESTSLHTFGARLFGKPAECFDYSLEAACQGGRSANGGRNEGKMVDARLNFHLPDGSLGIAPVLGLEYTHFSGDKPGSRNHEGWNPILSQCPLWTEELIPILFNGNWTNMNLFRGSFALKPMEKLRCELAVTGYYADEPNASFGTLTRTGNGNFMGLLLAATVDYACHENLSFRVQLSRFNPGDYFANGHDSIWGRFEATLRF